MSAPTESDVATLKFAHYGTGVFAPFNKSSADTGTLSLVHYSEGIVSAPSSTSSSSAAARPVVFVCT